MNEKRRERNLGRYKKYEAIREEKGFNDSDVAAGANVPRSTLSDWKTGRVTPGFGNIVKIANFLAVAANEFECEAGD